MDHAILTLAFDDGYRDTYEYALKYLDKLGIHFTFAVPVGLSGKTCENRPVVNWANISRLHKRGHDIASHTLTHKEFLPAKKYSTRAILDEIALPAALLHERLKTNDLSFVYPYVSRLPGTAVENMVRTVYTSARISQNSPVYNELPVKDRFALKGFCVTSDYGPDALNKCVERAVERGSWLIEVFHLVGKKNTESAHRKAPYRFFTHIDDFKRHIDFIISRQILIRTQKDVIKQYGGI